MNEYGEVYDQSSQVVSAGSKVSVAFTLDNDTNVTLNSKLDISVGKTSDPSIRVVSNSTSGYGFNYLRSGNAQMTMKISFVVPKKLLGTSQFIVLALRENGKLIHTPVFYLDVL